MTENMIIQENNNEFLLSRQGVIGTAIGEKWLNGKPTGEEAVLVFVEKKHKAESIINKSTLKQFTEEDLVPPEIDGVKTDVIEVGKIVKHNYRGKVRPIRPGFSVGHEETTAGTIGGIFTDSDGDLVILSNNHVLANENNAKIGDLIYQPGPADNKQNMKDIGWQEPIVGLPYIATLKRFAEIQKANNTHDSAIAKIHPRVIQSGLINQLYPQINSKLTGFNNATVGMQVQKCGRTTGYTTGRVLGVNASFGVQYDLGEAKFNKCIVMSGMSKGGDSGSLILDMDERAVGLLFAGSNKITLANPIEIVRDYYGLQLPEDERVQLDDDRWITKKSESSEISVSNVLKIKAPANHYACIERKIQSFKSIEFAINTGTDKGATWGTGVSIHWPNGYIKINLRYSMTFGGYVNGSSNLSVGKTRDNYWYKIRIRLTDKSYIGEINEDGKWYTIVEASRKVFTEMPQLIRLGKTDLNGGLSNHNTSGNVGNSEIKDLNFTG
jgi:hypothetical protein